MRPGTAVQLVPSRHKSPIMGNPCFVSPGSEDDKASPAFCIDPAGQIEPLEPEFAEGFGIRDAASVGVAIKEPGVTYALNDPANSSQDSAFYVGK